jgi:acyl-CoA synthetase (AMP-forming)/AMP-acid ligase II
VDLVADAATAHAARAAVTDRNGTLTYAALDAAVDVAAASLWGRGVARGDAVLLLAANDLPSVVTVHAVLRAGGVAMVAPTNAGAAQIADICAATQPVVVVAPRDAVDLDGADTWPTPADLLAGDAAAGSPAVRRDPDEPTIVIFTSGTTARPKGVVHSLNTMLAATRNYIDAAHLTVDDNLFVISPLASVTGLIQAITVAPSLGARVTLESRFDAPSTLDFLVETSATFFGGPDLLLDRVLDEAAARGLDSVPISAVYLGGSMLDPRILARAEHEYGIVVLRAYGSSEAPISTSSERGEPEAVRLADDGRALGGVEVRIGSTNDAAECCLSGAHLFLGYTAPEDDEGAFHTDDDGIDWLCTGDLAELRDGRLKVFGRIKDVVIRNGLKIPLAEVDGMVGALEGVEQCAGYGVPDDTTGERLAMAVRRRPGAEVGFDDIVEGLVAAGAARWKIPEELVLWDEPFPETPSGKVRRNALDAGAAGRPRTLAPRLRDP